MEGLKKIFEEEEGDVSPLVWCVLFLRFGFFFFFLH